MSFPTAHTAPTAAAPPADPTLAERAQRVSGLPARPQALTDVLRALQDPPLAPARCVALIEAEPALAARIMRLANSPFHGRAGTVSSVAAAVALLGMRLVTGVMAASALSSQLRPPAGSPFDTERHWRRASATAVGAAMLAMRVGLEASEAFLAGLMQDVGLLMLAVVAPASLAQVQARRASGLPRAAAERAVLGDTVPHLGAEVCRQWGFPPSIVAAIGAADGGADGGAPATTSAAVSLPDLLWRAAPLLEALAQGLEPGAASAALPETAWQALTGAPDEREPLIQSLWAARAAVWG
ncbi:MAG: HDOD domain-containing protein [Burkholderiales bacterium]|nr:HDOD domain-containing protein [Burkholderiales bacterium]